MSDKLVCYECGIVLEECEAIEIIDDEYGICEDCASGYGL